MSSVSLFRKWRSRGFSDLVGQEAVVQTLRNVLAGGSPARAYLFCGPRGTGKTSTARIFAKALCCERGDLSEPCNQCSTCQEINRGACLDVFEIDAASNTQVDKIRDFIVDKVHFAPAKARFKVYIIDEVHKLSSSSFNALLKTLEEPPPHVVFVLATTHPHEVLPTILSRCQRYDFRAFSLTELQNHLAHIAQSEGFSLDSEANLLLARAAQGSMRDALVLLEQAHHYSQGQIGVEQVTAMLGLLPQETLGQWGDWLRQGAAAELLGSVESMHRAGQDFVRAVDLWVDHLRLLMLTKVGAHQAGLSELSQAYREWLQSNATSLSLPQILLWLKAAVDLQQGIREGKSPRIALELCLVQLCQPTETARPTLEKPRAEAENPKPIADKPKPEFEPPRPNFDKPKPEPETAKPNFKKPEFVPPKPNFDKPKPEPEIPRPQPNTPKPQPAVESAALPTPANAREYWAHLQTAVRNQKQMKLLALLNDARVKTYTPELVQLSVPPTHQYHFAEINKSRGLLEEVTSQLLKNKVRFEVVVDSAQVAPPQEEEHETLVKKAHGLFGGRILDGTADGSSE